MGKRKNFIGVEDVLNIFDTNRVWYYIPGFNGYELSSDGYLRSMKHYRRYPYGILIQPVKRKPYNTSTDPLYATRPSTPSGTSFLASVWK